MQWRMTVAIGIVVGSVVWAVERRRVRPPARMDLWAEATDPVQPS